MRNSLVNAIRDQMILPKMVIIVPYEDVFQFVLKCNDSSLFTWGKILYWIMTEMLKAVNAHKDHLPIKAKRSSEPQFIWIEAPIHKNFRNNELRVKFNNCLREMSGLTASTSVLALKKIWDPSDTSYFIGNSDRLSVTGYKKYWEAIDRTVRYADTTFIRKIKINELRPKKPEEDEGETGSGQEETGFKMQQ